MTKQKVIPYSKSDVIAIKALFAGVANEGQQIAALNCIMNDLCKFYSREAYHGENVERALGRRELWLDLLEMSKLKTEGMNND